MVGEVFGVRGPAFNHHLLTGIGRVTAHTSLGANPLLLSTPMRSFMPKHHCWPLRVWCISGSRALSAFLVGLGCAPMMIGGVHDSARVDLEASGLQFLTYFGKQSLAQLVVIGKTTEPCAGW